MNQNQSRILVLEQWLRDNPDHDNRPLIEADLRKIQEEKPSSPVERDTYDLREHNFYDV